MKKISEYQQKALNFLKATNTTFKAEFLRHGKHFENDKDARDIYSITLQRGQRVYTFNFGQSINCSGEYQVKEHLRNKLWCKETTGGKYALTEKEVANTRLRFDLERGDIYKNPNFEAPTEYDVLACLQKYDVGTFENFCGDFGYDTDSRTAEKVYKAVCNEYKNVAMLFNDSEIEQLNEIQ